MVGSPEEAEEVLQEAMLNAFRNLHRFEGRSQFSTWLTRIVINAALMRLRTRRNRPEGSIDDLLPRFAEAGHFAEEPGRWAASSHELLERGETRAMVRRCIDRLPERYRRRITSIVCSTISCSRDKPFCNTSGT